MLLYPLIHEYKETKPEKEIRW